MVTKTIASPKTTTNTNGLLKTSVALNTNGARLAQFPEFPPRYDMQNIEILHEIGYIAPLKRYLGAEDTTLVYGEVPIGTTLSVRLGLRIPDLIIAFDCDPDLVIERQGYDITEQGKPPDFVLEIASKTTGRVDYTEKRIDYERYGIPEYWRFDATGGDYHDAALAGDRLVEGRYEPIAVDRVGDGFWRGYSEALGLHLCWDGGKLRWYDAVDQSYLRTFYDEVERADREAAARRHAEESAAREAAARRMEAAARRLADERAEREAARALREAAARRQETERADRAEAELRRLRERMRQRGDDR